MQNTEEKLQKLHENGGGGKRRGIMSALDELERRFASGEAWVEPPLPPL